MKRLIPWLLATGLGFVAGVVLVGRPPAVRDAHELESQRAAWAALQKGGLSGWRRSTGKGGNGN